MEQAYCSPRLMRYPECSMLAASHGATQWLPACGFFSVPASLSTGRHVAGGGYALEP